MTEPVRDAEYVRGEPMPDAPAGFSACRTYNGRTQTQTSHLVRWINGGTGGPTLCGLTRFDQRDPETYAVIRKADLPGWGMDGGIYGPAVAQVKCEPCWRLIDGTDDGR